MPNQTPAQTPCTLEQLYIENGLTLQSSASEKMLLWKKQGRISLLVKGVGNRFAFEEVTPEHCNPETMVAMFEEVYKFNRKSGT